MSSFLQEGTKGRGLHENSQKEEAAATKATTTTGNLSYPPLPVVIVHTDMFHSQTSTHTDTSTLPQRYRSRNTPVQQARLIIIPVLYNCCYYIIAAQHDVSFSLPSLVSGESVYVWKNEKLRDERESEIAETKVPVWFGSLFFRVSPFLSYFLLSSFS